MGQDGAPGPPDDGGGRAARTARAAVLSPRPRGSFVRDEADSPSP